MHNLNKLISKDLVNSLPKLKFEKEKVYEVCQKGKQTKTYFKQKNYVSYELFCPSRIMSVEGNYNALVIVVDFYIFTWTLFLVSKNDDFKLVKLLQNKKVNALVLLGVITRERFKMINLTLFC